MTERAARRKQDSVRVGADRRRQLCDGDAAAAVQGAARGFSLVATASGVSANDVGKKFGFARAVSTADEVIDDEEVNLVVIGTQHDLHATAGATGLEGRPHVFVEKPLALNDEDLDAVLHAAQNSSRHD